MLRGALVNFSALYGKKKDGEKKREGGKDGKKVVGNNFKSIGWGKKGEGGGAG